MLGLKLNHVSKRGRWSLNELQELDLTTRHQDSSPTYYRHSCIHGDNQQTPRWLNKNELRSTVSLQWRHNGRDGVSNHQPHDCLLKCLFKRKSKKTSKICVTGFCAGNSPVTGKFPHKWPVTRKIFPFGDVIMSYRSLVPCLTWPPTRPSWHEMVPIIWSHQSRCTFHRSVGNYKTHLYQLLCHHGNGNSLICLLRDIMKHHAKDSPYTHMAFLTHRECYTF